MKLHYLLLLLLCSISTKSFAAAPDSVFIFTYAIPQDPHKGIHIAYSADGKSWKAIGQDQSFVSSDFGSWGSQKRMFHPSVIKDGDRWYAVWQVNDNTNQFATTWSDKLSVWKPQDYPYVETPNVIAPMLSKRGGRFIVTYKTKDNKVYQVESSDFKKWSKAHEVSTYVSNEKKVKVEGTEHEGCITRAPWSLIENLINKGDATTLRNRQYGERIQNFFYSQGVDKFVDQYRVDGSLPEENEILQAGGFRKLRHSIGLVATTAAASVMCSHDKSKEFVDAFWKAEHKPFEDGYFDAYYDGLLRLFAYMHLSGNYRVIFPQK